ncbi:MAG TPA: GAF domain-containing protein [Ktedonobacteraceae bacterium]|nr:GAF domain-containing protein [Ktedonobacteraceae bacterium]
MKDSSTWRELLGSIIQDPQERRRLANDLGINPVTLTRWVNNESSPRSQSIQRLLNALPQHRKALLDQLLDEFGGLIAESEGLLTEGLLTKIPSEFYIRVLRTRATIPQVLRFSSLCDLILQQALEQLDPNRVGIAVTVVRCMPPSANMKIRSLRESVGRGTPPWESSLDQQAILLGAESLAGHAVSLGHLVVNMDLSEKQSLSPGYHGQWEESASAAPIMLEGKVSGCLLVSSSQPNYFQQSRQALIEGYADLLALAFDTVEFYDPGQIELGLVPFQEVQKLYLADFRQRLSELMIQATKNQQSLTIFQAEQIVWQQFEEELLGLPQVEESKKEISRQRVKGAMNDNA